MCKVGHRTEKGQVAVYFCKIQESMMENIRPTFVLRRQANRELKLAMFFEPRTATGSGLFSSSNCLHTAVFILLSIVSLVETKSLKIWERPLSWQEKSSDPVSVRGSETSLT